MRNGSNQVEESEGPLAGNLRREAASLLLAPSETFNAAILIAVPLREADFWGRRALVHGSGVERHPIFEGT